MFTGSLTGRGEPMHISGEETRRAGEDEQRHSPGSLLGLTRAKASARSNFGRGQLTEFPYAIHYAVLNVVAKADRPEF
jgi:hypothetical protein